MLRTSRRNAKISAYEEMEGPFDFNKTPISILGTKGLAYLSPDDRATFQHHGVDTFYTGRKPMHYRLLELFDPKTRSYRSTGSYKLYPTHCKVPTISEADKTIIAANELMEVLKLNVPPQAKIKQKHINIIQQLTSIITDTTAPMVGDAPAPRVGGTATPSTDATSPRVVKQTRYVHQRQTRNNTPMPTIMEEEEPIISDQGNENTMENDGRRVTRSRSQQRTQPRIPPTRKTRKVQGDIIGSKRNNAKKASRKRVQQLIDIQTARDEAIFKRMQAHEEMVADPSDVPGMAPTEPIIQAESIPTTGGDSGQPVTFEDLPTSASERPSNLPTVTQEDEPDRILRDTPTFRSPNCAMFVRQEALHFVLGQAMLSEIPGFMPQDKDNVTNSQMPIDIAEMANGVVHPVTKETITKYQKLIDEPLLRETWMKAMCIELGRLSQGYGDTKGTNTIKYLSLEEIKGIPGDRTVTYARIVVDYRPQKEDPNRVRITVGGNLIDYPFELTTRTADLTTSKVMWNSVISTPGARYACADVKNFYLETPLDRYEYMIMPIKLIPQEIIDQYDLMPKVKNGHVYMEIRKGMYGLPQSGILSNKLLKERLSEHGYYELPHTPGLFTHKTRPVWFTLVVDDFGIKYIGKQHAEHLISVLRGHYSVEVDWEGLLYCGITLDWHYDDRYVDISMPNYVHKQLVRYRRKQSKHKQHCPYQPKPIQYGKNSNLIKPEEDSPPVGKEDEKYIRQVVGSFLYYARAVDLTILTALNDIASEQSKPTERTLQRVEQLLDYMETNPGAVIRFRASDMVLNLHSDASYLSASRGRSRAGGYFFLGSLPKNGEPIFLNGNIAITCAIIKLVAASAAEAELAALFINAQEAKIIRLILHELGHPQPPTPIHVDNTTAVGIVNNTIKRQRSRSMEMRYFWLLDQETQRYIRVFYHPGQENLGDYPSKHHEGKIHQHVRPYYVHMPTSPTHLPRAGKPSSRQGCAEILGDPYVKMVPLPMIPNYRDLG